MKKVRVLLLSILCLGLLAGCGSGGTISKDYSSKDVLLRCTKVETEDEAKKTTIAEIVDFGSDTRIYGKAVKEYKNLTDEKVLEILKKADKYGDTVMADTSSYNVNGTTELGISNYGYDTVIKRDGNTVTLTYYTSLGGKLTSSDIKESKKELSNDGFECK